MSEYIERETLIDLIKNGNGRIPDWVEEYISECPTADVEPVKHGQWIEEDDTAVCSVCGERQGDTDIQLTYCPWCGAKMDGEDDK